MCAGVGWCRQVPEGSGEFRCAGFRSSRRFRRVPACWCTLRSQAPEGSGGFRRVPVCAGVGTGGRVRKVPESYGLV